MVKRCKKLEKHEKFGIQPACEASKRRVAGWAVWQPIAAIPPPMRPVRVKDINSNPLRPSIHKNVEELEEKTVNDILNGLARADPIATQQKVLLLHFCVMHFCLKVDHSAQTATCHRSKHGGFKGIRQKRAKYIEAGHREIQHVNEFCMPQWSQLHQLAGSTRRLWAELRLHHSPNVITDLGKGSNCLNFQPLEGWGYWNLGKFTYFHQEKGG